MHKRPEFCERLSKRLAAGHITEAEKELSLFISGQCGIELLLRNIGTHWVASFEWSATHCAESSCPNEAVREFGRSLHAEGYINADTLSRFMSVNIPDAIAGDA